MLYKNEQYNKYYLIIEDQEEFILFIFRSSHDLSDIGYQAKTNPTCIGIIAWYGILFFISSIFPFSFKDKLI